MCLWPARRWLWGGSPWDRGASTAPQLWEHTELAMVPNALQRQSPDPAQAPPGLVTQQGTFVLLFLSLQPHIRHCTSRKAPKLCPTRENPSPWLEWVCGLFSPVYLRGL